MRHTLMRLCHRIAREPLVALGVAVAAANAVGSNRWEDYVVAAAVALARWAVTPVVQPLPSQTQTRPQRPPSAV